MNKFVLVSLLTLVFTFAVAADSASINGNDEKSVESKSAVAMFPGKKIQIGNGYYFKYRFNARPSMGTTILSVKVFDSNGNQVTPFQMTGDCAMSGMHDAGPVQFTINKKNDYVLPLNVAMQGDWEVKLVIKKDSTEVFSGSIPLKV